MFDILQEILQRYGFLINSFIILAVLRSSVKGVCEAHIRVVVPGQHKSLRRNVAAVASRWQHCVRFDRPEI